MINTTNNTKEMNVFCVLCFKEYRKFHPFQKHHISYYPPIILPVHDDCHLLIHDNDITEFIQYTKEDALRFRKKCVNPKLNGVRIKGARILK